MVCFRKFLEKLFSKVMFLPFAILASKMSRVMKMEVRMDDEGGGEALDGTATEHEEDDTGEDGGHLSVDDGGVGVAVTVGHGLAETLAGGKLFLDSFVDDHVRIHCHTHGQDETCDTGQGEHGSEGNQCAEEEENVAQKGYVSCDTGSHVEEDHVDEHQDEGDDE